MTYMFNDGEVPGCLDAADTTDNGTIDLADAINVLDYLFNDWQALPLPFPCCGIDATPDSLDCNNYDCT